jgi:hypothetical protein
MNSHRHCCRHIWGFTICFSLALAWHSPTLNGDIVIELEDGTEIVVSVDEEKVRAIRLGRTRENILEMSAGGDLPSQDSTSTGNVISVGPDRAIRLPSEAAKLASDGDVIEIDAGIYHNDYAKWPQNRLTIRGVGAGPAHMKSDGLIPNGKAIWITRGDKIYIENIEFSGAAVKSTNGAGIRLEGGDLKLHNTFFHDNEFSILGGNLPQATVEITSSRFWFQKRPTRHSHGIYIGQAKSFTLKGSHIKGTDQGHHLKSRALENYILYNRIEDAQGVNSSRLIDLPNCGFSVVLGNDMLQSASTLNTNAIGYGPEGCAKRTGNQLQLLVVNNTLINEASNGTLVRNHADSHVTVINNVLFGAGSFLIGDGDEKNNFREDLRARRPGSWEPPKGSPAVDAAITQPAVAGFSLTPVAEFQSPAGYIARITLGKLDAGSREVSAP